MQSTVQHIAESAKSNEGIRLIAHRVRNENLSTDKQHKPGCHHMTSTEVATVAYELGWDMAHYAVRPRREWESIQKYLEQGYREGLYHFQGRYLPSDPFIRKWLRLRGSALVRGKICHDSVTPEFLRSIAPQYCPITRKQLCYELTENEVDEGSVWSVDRLNNQGAYIAGNLVIMSKAANSAKANYCYDDLKIIVEQVRASGLQAWEGLTEGEWSRLKTLTSVIALREDNWREIALQQSMVAPPNYIFIHGAVWILISELLFMPWEVKNSAEMAKLWSSRTKDKSMSRLAFDVAEMYAKSCLRLSKSKSKTPRWIAEEAWTNPAFQQAWGKFISRASEMDIAKLMKHKQTHDMQSWFKAAGIVQ